MAASPKQRILVVDDEKAIADILALILNSSGWEAKAVYSGEAAIETAAEFAPDLILSDVVMRGINGIDACIQIRQGLPDCRVVLFSGQAATVNLLEKARKSGLSFEILAKPVDPQFLIRRLESLFADANSGE